MRLYFFLIIVAFMFAIASCINDMDQSNTAKVEVVENNGAYQLLKNGKPFYIKGAGLEFGNIEALAQNGANTFRTWRTENGKQTATEVLDEAHKHGLMVLMGIEIGRERHGFDYNDSVWVQEQYDYVKREVLKYKDHPALLAWGIGNELNLESTNMKVWDEVNRLSELIHDLDANHPTTTSLAGISSKEIDYMKTNCTDLDFVSIQMYGDIVNLQERIEDSGYEGPYVVTEWGATGHWEGAITSWNAPIEQTSKEKAKAFRDRYTIAIASDPDHCLGSYVFLWGQKQERTPTWYGMFLENGYKTETVDAMHFIWNDKWPETLCPSIDSLLLNKQTAYDNIRVTAGELCSSEVFFNANNNDTISVIWEIIPESSDLKLGGDDENRPNTILLEHGNKYFDFNAPMEQGAYRIFVYVLGEDKNAGTANIPFLVE